jgi:hypothetical protein
MFYIAKTTPENLNFPKFSERKALPVRSADTLSLRVQVDPLQLSNEKS